MKPEFLHQYPRNSLEFAEAGLLSAWSALGNYRSDLVLVGGLAVRYMTRPSESLPGTVTMDVDLGITRTFS